MFTVGAKVFSTTAFCAPKNAGFCEILMQSESETQKEREPLEDRKEFDWVKKKKKNTT